MACGDDDDDGVHDHENDQDCSPNLEKAYTLLDCMQSSIRASSPTNFFFFLFDSVVVPPFAVPGRESNTRVEIELTAAPSWFFSGVETTVACENERDLLRAFYIKYCVSYATTVRSVYFHKLVLAGTVASRFWPNPCYSLFAKIFLFSAQRWERVPLLFKIFVIIFVWSLP